MERQGWENNDFSGGLSDEYIPTKDNRLDISDNTCLDDDLTVIQRPGSAQLEGSDGQFGKHPDQTKVKGLQETETALYSFTPSRVFRYAKSIAGAFVRSTPDSGDYGEGFAIPIPEADPATFNEVRPAYIPLTPPAKLQTFNGSVNSFQTKNVTYSTSSMLSFPQKIYNDAELSRGVRTMSAGLPRLPEMFSTNGLLFTPQASALSLYYVSSSDPSFVAPKSIPIAVARTGTFNAPDAADTWGWSDKPFTYKDGNLVKTYAHAYQFSYCLVHKYEVDGIKFEKRSPPVTPSYFLSDFPLTKTEISPGSYREYIVRASLGLHQIFALMREMNVAFLGRFGDLFTEETELGIEVYLSDDNATIMSSRTMLEFPANTIFDYYDYVNGNTLLGGDDFFYIQHTRAANETFNTLYTSGGVLPFDPPPPCRYLFFTGTYGFYLNIKELSVDASNIYNYKNVKHRLKISNANDPDSVPEGNFVDFPDELTGGGGVLDRAIVGTVNEIYRIDGRYDSLGAGLVNGQLLSSETGILSHKSVVSVKDKLFFCGDDGIYVTDGVAVLPISRHISRTYRALIDAISSDATGEYIDLDRVAAQEKISAVYDRVYDRIIFSFGTQCLALELKASKLEEGYGSFFGPWFTGFNKASTPESFSALGLYKDRVVRGDEYGYITQMSPGYLSDPRISNAAVNTWGKYPIVYLLRTCKLAFGSLMVKKWVSYVTFVLKRRKVLQGGQTEIDVQVHGYNDGERIRQTLRPAHYNGERDNLYDESPKVAGFLVPKVISDTLVNFQRRFGASGMRCVTKAVEFTNGMNLVGKSDTTEPALVAGVFASLPNYPTQQWPKEAQDLNQNNYIISFDYDNYQMKFLITSVSGGTLTLDAAPTAGSHKWKLYSFSSKQFFGLQSLSLIYTPFSSKHSTYTVAEQGGNAGDTGE